MRLSQLHESTKFRLVVFNEEFAVLVAVDAGMEAGDRDISHSDVSIVTSSYSDAVSTLHIDNVDNSYILQGNTFHDYEVSLWSLILKYLYRLAQFRYLFP